MPSSVLSSASVISHKIHCLTLLVLSHLIFLFAPGGDSVQAYAKGPGGLVFHGSVVDKGNGNYTVSAWPVLAGVYQMSVLISALERSRWALGYRQGSALRR